MVAWAYARLAPSTGGVASSSISVTSAAAVSGLSESTTAGTSVC